MEKKRVALVDDDETILAAFGSLLRYAGYACFTYQDPFDFIKNIGQENRFDVVVLDMNMPKVTGIELISWIRKRDPELPIVMMTAWGSEDIEELAYRSGANLFLQKPVSLDALTRTLRLITTDGLSGEVFHVNFMECIQTLGCDSSPKVLKIQEKGSSEFFIALKNGMLEGLSHQVGEQHVHGLDALPAFNEIEDATFSEIIENVPQHLSSQNLSIPLPKIVLDMAQYQDEKSLKAIRAHTIGVWGNAQKKMLLSKLLNNIGLIASEDINACQAHLVLDSSDSNLEKILLSGKPILMREQDILSTSAIKKTNSLNVITGLFEKPSDWICYIKNHFSRGVSGTFNNISVFQLIQLISQANVTGCIKLKDFIRQQESCLYFVHGKLIEAICQSAKEELSGKQALFNCIRIRRGFFQQIHFEEPPSRQLESYTTSRLLMDFSRPFELQETFNNKIDDLLSPHLSSHI